MILIHFCLCDIKCLELWIAQCEVTRTLTRIYKSFHWVTIDTTIDIQHDHLSKTFWCMFNGSLHVVFNVLKSEKPNKRARQVTGTSLKLTGAKRRFWKLTKQLQKFIESHKTKVQCNTIVQFIWGINIE